VTELSVREAAVRAGWTARYVYALVWVGGLEGARKVDGTWRIPSEAVDARQAKTRERRRRALERRATAEVCT
jgi:excisionase family DNA binding protein